MKVIGRLHCIKLDDDCDVNDEGQHGEAHNQGIIRRSEHQQAE